MNIKQIITSAPQLIADAQQLHDNIDKTVAALNAAAPTSSAAIKFLSNARAAVSLALGQLNAHVQALPDPVPATPPTPGPIE